MNEKGVSWNLHHFNLQVGSKKSQLEKGGVELCTLQLLRSVNCIVGYRYDIALNLNLTILLG